MSRREAPEARTAAWRRSGLAASRVGLLILALAAGCAQDPETDSVPATGQGDAGRRWVAGPESPAGFQFVDVTAAVGLDFRHISGSPEQRYILESMSSGAAFFDYDGDGYQDVFLVNSTRMRETPEEATNRLYRNIATETGSGVEKRAFREVTDEAGLRATGWGMGCAVGDYDNDGNPDLYVTYWGPNALYRNDGNGRFAKVAAGVEDDRWGTSAAFGDVDGDGYLDLYVANYLVFDMTAPPGGGLPCSGWKGLDVYCGPHGMEAQANALYRNDGDGGFTDVSEATGTAQHRQASLGVVFADYDTDGDQDIYVANDGYPNLLYRNDGNWQLSEVAAFAGAAYSEDGRAQAGMGVAAGDYDNDGDLDFYVTHFSDDVNTLYRNQGDGTFVDFTAGGKLGGEVRPFLGWSTGFFDGDNDGWLDLFVVNGHIYPQVDVQPSGLRYAQRNLFYRNQRGEFREMGAAIGAGFSERKVSRGAALGDYDNDGDLDLLVMNLNEAPTLLHNFGGNRNNWLGLELEGVESNRHGLGAVVRLFSGDEAQMREVQRGSGYLSQRDGRVLFGLGEKEHVDRVEIRWPSGRVQTLERPELRRYLVVREGRGDPVASYVGSTGLEEMISAPTPATTEQKPESRATAHPAAHPDWTAEEHYRSGVEFYKRGRYQEALHAFRTAIGLNPDEMRVYYSLGVTLYSGLGRSREAVEVLEQAVERDSTWAQIYHLLGTAHLDLNRTEAAVRAFKRSGALDSAPWQVHNQLGLAHLRRAELTAAAAAFQEGARRAPWKPQLHLHLARVYELQGNLDAVRREREIFERLRPAEERVASYLEALADYPQQVETRCLLGQAYFEQGRIVDARSCFDLAIDTDSTYAPAYYGLGAALHYQGDLAPAIAAYERACRLDPDLVEALADLGQAYQQAEHYDGAIDAYESVLELRPEWSVARTKLGMVYATLGRLEQAARAFQAALATDSTLIEARDALGRVYSAEGRYEAAIQQWESLLRLAPDHPRASGRIRQARQKLEEGEKGQPSG